MIDWNVHLFPVHFLPFSVHEHVIQRSSLIRHLRYGIRLSNGSHLWYSQTLEVFNNVFGGFLLQSEMNTLDRYATHYGPIQAISLMVWDRQIENQ